VEGKKKQIAFLPWFTNISDMKNMFGRSLSWMVYQVINELFSFKIYKQLLVHISGHVHSRDSLS
jgi:hypothetical protein